MGRTPVIVGSVMPSARNGDPLAILPVGVVPNDEAGRAALWSDILTINTELENIRAIDTFDEESLVVAEGNTKRAVVVTETITIIGTMEQLYMTITVE